MKETSEKDCDVLKMNHKLEDSPVSINTNPYDHGLMIKVNADNLSQVNTLMTSNQSGHAEKSGAVR